MKIKLLIGCVCLLNLFCTAQNNFKNYTLLIPEEKPIPKIEEKLNSTELESYRNEIESYNVMLKKCVSKYWLPDIKVEYVSKEKIQTLVASKAQHILYLVNTKYSFNYADKSSYLLSQKLYNKRNEIVENYSKKQLPYRACRFELRIASNPAQSQPLIMVPMPSVVQAEADLVYAIKSLALQIDYRNKGVTEVQFMKMYIKNAPKLKELTLLLNKEDVDYEIQSNIAQYYSLPFVLCDFKAIEQAILNADNKKAFNMTIPNADGSFSFKVMAASTMEVLGQSGSIAPSEYYPELNNKIKAKQLGEFTHYCNE